MLQILGESSTSNGWIPLSVDSILTSKEALNQCVNCLVVLNGLMSSAKKGDISDSDLLRLEEVFSDSRGVDSSHDVVCGQLVVLASQAIKIAGPSIDSISNTLFWFLLQASSMQSQDNMIREAESCIRRLAAEIYPMQASELQLQVFRPELQKKKRNH